MNRAISIGTPICSRCGIGYDTNGDGDCIFCYKLSDEQLAMVKPGIVRERRELSINFWHFVGVWVGVPVAIFLISKWMAKHLF